MAIQARAPLMAALTALLVFCLLHRDGMPLDQDGWAMWQAAASLADGQGYRYFSGHPILAWPPLYPAYMAAWMLVLGPMGLALMAANALLIVAQAFLWMRLALAIAGIDEAGRREGSLPLLAIFLGVFVALNQPQVFAHNLVYVLLSLYLGSLWRLMKAPGSPDSAGELVRMTLLGICLMATHNACAAFVAAGATMLFFRRPLSYRQAVSGIIVFNVPVFAWLALRFVLGQTDSHAIGLGLAREGALEYARQFAIGIGRPFVPDRVGAPFVAAALLLLAGLVLARTRQMRFALTYTVFAIVGTYCLFNLSWIATSLATIRPVLFVPLLLGPAIYLSSLAIRPRVARAALALLLVPQLYWLALDTLHLSTTGAASWNDLERQVRQNGDWKKLDAGLPLYTIVPWDGYISRSYREGPPMRTEHGLLIAPLPFEEPTGRRS